MICKIFGHKWIRNTIWHNRLKVNINEYHCARCGKVDADNYIKTFRDMTKTICEQCGAWVCHSGICIHCERD